MTTVLFIHGITEIGGAERELLLILDRLPQFGYRAVVVCPQEGPLVEELSRRGVRTRCAPLPPWRKLFAYPRRPAGVKGLRDVILMERPALLHVNDIWWVPQTVRAAKDMGVPVIAHVRQDIEPWKAQRYELNRPDLVLAVSRRIQESLEAGGVSSKRLQTLYSGLDVTRIPPQEDCQTIRHRLGIPAHGWLIGTVANIFPRKGYDVMFQALPAILALSPHTHYLVIGSGNNSYEKALRLQIRDTGLEAHVHFAGFQESVYPLLAALDVYVHPARMEGLPISVLEAMAMRKPVVATTAGGIPEIVHDCKTGVLVPVGDPDALAQAVLSLLEDTRRRDVLGEAGRNRIETHFTLETMMSHLTTAYGSVLRGQGQLPHSVSI